MGATKGLCSVSVFRLHTRNKGKVAKKTEVMIRRTDESGPFFDTPLSGGIIVMACAGSA